MRAKLTNVLHALHAALLRPDTWQKLRKCDVLLVSGDHNCGYTYQGKAYAHLIDSLSDLFVKHGLVTRTVAKPYAKLTGTRAYNSPVSYNNAALIVGLLRRVIRLLRNDDYSEEWANKRREDLWCHILDKANPRYVIGIQPDPGLCRAGKIKVVPVYDLQHGVITDEHPWYGAKYRTDTPSMNLPHGFLCWDEPSAVALRKWAPQKGIDVRVIGNPWFVRFLFKDSTDHLVKEALKEGRIFYNNRPTILVSLQWGLRYYYKQKEFNGVMIDALEKAILETAGEYNWCLRLHPVQIRGSEKQTAQGYLKQTFGHLNSVEWNRCSVLPLPLVLQQVNLHITDTSTMVVEAGWLGIYSALLNSNICPGGSLENYYSYERNLGLATVLPQNTTAIKKWIEETLVKGKGKSSLVDARDELSKFIDEVVAACQIK